MPIIDSAKVASVILGKIWGELIEWDQPGRAGSLARSTTIIYSPDRILIRLEDGETVEVTARRLERGGPSVERLEASIRAIDAGDVE